MIITARNTTSENISIYDLGGLSITASGSSVLTEMFKLYEIANSDSLLSYIASTAIVINDGEKDLSVSDGIKYVTLHNVIEGPKDRSGKLRIQNTPRQLGLKTYWTGAGDDISNPHNVGNGNQIDFKHSIGDPSIQVVYMDLNCEDGYNESWVFEGYLHWLNALNDRFTWEMVSAVTPIKTGQTGTNYSLYGGYLIVPAAGNGDILINSDITTSSGGLVYVPLNDLGEKSFGYWDATWNTSTQRYENIRPTPDGSGWYNMFATEKVFARFMNRLSLLGSNSIRIGAWDIDQLGQGVRFKATWETCGEDHDWMSCGWATMFRKRTV